SNAGTNLSDAKRLGGTVRVAAFVIFQHALFP
ncbi:MAG: hypothetical protein ACI9Y1_003528, partial [Lentisphaeria bacterium]